MPFPKSQSCITTIQSNQAPNTFKFREDFCPHPPVKSQLRLNPDIYQSMGEHLRREDNTTMTRISDTSFAIRLTWFNDKGRKVIA